MNKEGAWIITEQKQREKRTNEINDELSKEKRVLEQIKSDLNYAFIMNREKEVNQLKEQAILIGKNIEILNKKRKEINFTHKN